MDKWSINSSLPPLKCAYAMASIDEEQPYVAMEEMVSDSRYVSQPENSRNRCCSFFCFNF